MPPVYNSPGVYIVEVPIRPTVISPAGASSLAIFAPFKFGPTNAPVVIRSWNDFVNTFVHNVNSDGTLDPRPLFNYPSGGGAEETRQRKIRDAAYAIYLYFLNGGGTAYVFRSITGTVASKGVSTGTDAASITATAKYAGKWPAGWKVELSITTPLYAEAGKTYYNIRVLYGTIVVEEFSGISFHSSDLDKPYHASKVNSRYFTFSASSDTFGTVSPLTIEFTNSDVSGVTEAELGDDAGEISTIANFFKDAGGIYTFVVPQWEESSLWENFKTLVQSVPYSIAVVSFRSIPADSAVAGARSDKVVFYYPYINVQNPYIRGVIDTVSPSGAIAGKYSYTDVSFNPGRVPAGLAIGSLTGVQSLYYGNSVLTKLSQVDIDANYPRHYNPIVLQSDGYYLWGARASSFSFEWRYINKRRLFNFLEKSIKDALIWVNFENNTPATRFAVRNQIDLFLRRLTLEGYFASTNPAEAYYVVCDDTNNPPDLVEQGYLVVDIGVAPSKPAEFVVLRFTEKTATAQ